MMHNVVITGSKGVIGSIIRGGLTNSRLFLIDKKERNGGNCYKLDVAKDYAKLLKVFSGKDTIIHLAWNFFEDFPKENICDDNKKMAENVYRAAVANNLKRVIIASSVHANDYSGCREQKNFDKENPRPDSPYGASKVYIESLGRYYSKYHDLEVVCIRFGGVNRYDKPIYKEDPNYDKVLLFKDDCLDLINKCVNVKKVSNKYQILTAVSANLNRVHRINNFLNWRPKYPKNAKYK